MKKSSLIILALFSVLFLASFAAAQETILESLGSNATAFLNSIFLTPFTLSVILLGLLLWIVIYSIVVKIGLGGGKGAWSGGAAVVSLIIVILSFIYLPKDFVTAIVLQYGAMGATILTVIPFFIMLYFSIAITRSLFTARIIWTFYIVYYFAIFIYKIVQPGTTWTNAIPYIGAIVAGAIVIFFLPTIRNIWWKGELSAAEEKGIRDISFRKLGRKLEREETKARTTDTEPEHGFGLGGPF
jgi:hypothetical protein